MAYCLLGIFNVNMPLLYGEGSHAFLRLQEEIIKTHNDDSILALGLNIDGTPLDQSEAASAIKFNGVSDILASSPSDFSHCHELQCITRSDVPMAMSSASLEMQLPVVTLDDGWRHIVLLRCSTGVGGELVGILIRQENQAGKHLQVHRNSYGIPAKVHTFLVGPRVAARAEMANVVVVKSSEIAMARRYMCNYMRVIVNRTPALAERDYAVTDGWVTGIVWTRGTSGTRSRPS